MAIGSHTKPNRGATDSWLTPPHIIDALGGYKSFWLDPCCPDNMPWKTAINMWTKADNSLQKRWISRVWMNPPYGKKTGLWLKKLADHGNGIALIFARTETEMFFEQVWNRADGILFLEGRLHFHYPNGERAKANAGGPSCLVAYGEECVDDLYHCKLDGARMKIWETR